MKEELLKKIGKRYREAVYRSSNSNFFIYNKLNFCESVKLYGGKSYDNVLLTIMIPTFGRAELLERCIKSAIDQNTSINYEILIIDNNPDHLKNSPIIDILKKYNDNRIVYYCNKKNLGSIGNWNNGFQIARGKWVVMLHDDDIMHPNWIEIMINACYKLGDNADVISCKLSEIFCNQDVVKFQKSKVDYGKIKKCNLNDIAKGMVIPVLGSLVRKNFFERIGGFRTDIFYIADYIFMGNAIKKGNVYCINEKLYGYGISDVNASSNGELWNAVLVSEYYYTQNILTECGHNIRYSELYARFKLCSSIIAHNYPKLKLCAFKNTKVNKKLIMQLCDINSFTFNCIYLVAFLYSFCVYLKHLVCGKEK